MVIWPWTKMVRMVPPEDTVTLCPVCNANVEEILLVKKSRKTGPTHAHVFPCEHTLHTKEELLGMVGGG